MATIPERDLYDDFKRFPLVIVKGPSLLDIVFSQFGRIDGEANRIPTFELVVEDKSGYSTYPDRFAGAKITTTEWLEDVHTDQPYRLRIRGKVFPNPNCSSSARKFEAYYSDVTRKGVLRFLDLKQKQVGLDKPRTCKAGDIVWFQCEGEEGMLLHLLSYIEEGTYGDYWHTQEENERKGGLKGLIPNWQANLCPLIGRAKPGVALKYYSKFGSVG